MIYGPKPNPKTNLPSGQRVHAHLFDPTSSKNKTYVCLCISRKRRPCADDSTAQNLRGVQVAEAALILRGRTLSRVEKTTTKKCEPPILPRRTIESIQRTTDGTGQSWK